nr:MAG TPA: hypothetical protein [Caudoviricetes sp.]
MKNSFLKKISFHFELNLKLFLYIRNTLQKSKKSF